jgi:hypothetical protein
MRRTIWSPQAADGLAEALDYLVKRNPQAAALLAQRVLALGRLASRILMPVTLARCSGCGANAPRGKRHGR